jgi:hypothetical protein
VKTAGIKEKRDDTNEKIRLRTGEMQERIKGISEKIDVRNEESDTSLNEEDRIYLALILFSVTSVASSFTGHIHLIIK